MFSYTTASVIAAAFPFAALQLYGLPRHRICERSFKFVACRKINDPIVILVESEFLFRWHATVSLNSNQH